VSGDLWVFYEYIAAAGRSPFTADKGAEENRGCHLQRGGGLYLHQPGFGNPEITHHSCKVHHGHLQQKVFLLAKKIISGCLTVPSCTE